jgi:hypothetical protein
MSDEQLQHRLFTTSKSPYASPAFLEPKGGCQYRLVVDYHKANAKINFNCYPLPSIDLAFEMFGAAVDFSVLDLNLAYYQIPLSAQSHGVTLFVRHLVCLKQVNCRWELVLVAKV